jgi:hypothetical protein
VARVPSWRDGPRAARFHRPVAAEPQERRPERHRCPAGDRHHRRSPRPQLRASGSSRGGKSLEQSAPGLCRRLGWASFLVRLADAALAVPSWAFDTDALSSADFRAVADKLATWAVAVPTCVSANRGFLHTSRYSPTFVNTDAYLNADAVEHADGDAYLHGDAVEHADAYLNAIYHAYAHTYLHPGVELRL